MFDFIYNPDGTCHMWHCHSDGVVLAYDDMQPEFAWWFCADCWCLYESDWFKIAIDTRYIGPAYQLPALAVSKEIVQAVSDFAWKRYRTITRSDVDQWYLDKRVENQLEFENGYLVIHVEDVFIVDFEFEDGYQTWYVSASIDAGFGEVGDPDVYEAYKGDDGEWIIEWSYS